MSPEQMYGNGQTLACDLWGLGCLIYELLVGKTPFAADSMMELNSNVLVGVNNRILSQLHRGGSGNSRSLGNYGEQQGGGAELVEELCHGLLRKRAIDRIGSTNWNDLEHHRWFSNVGVDLEVLKTGRFQTGDPFWKPNIDGNRVGEYYYNDNDEPLTFHDEVAKVGKIGNQRVQMGGGGTDDSGSQVDLPWHWVF